jgi:TPR repeat protein
MALVGGAPAGAVLLKLFESKDAAVRKAAAENRQHGILSDATTSGLAKLVKDPEAMVRRAAIRALAMYDNWRYQPAQRALIQLAMDGSADPADRLNATDAIRYAVRFQVKGVRQDPPMFRALVSLLQDEGEPVRSAAAGILAPVYEFGGGSTGRRRAPEGGWDKWLDQISARREEHPATGDLAAAFKQRLKAAEGGSVAAQSAVAMLYANGKGVRQNYAEAGKWWMRASEGGDLDAGRLAWNLYRNGEGVDRNPALANRMAKLIGRPIQVPLANAAQSPVKQ